MSPKPSLKCSSLLPLHVIYSFIFRFFPTRSKNKCAILNFKVGKLSVVEQLKNILAFPFRQLFLHVVQAEYSQIYYDLSQSMKVRFSWETENNTNKHRKKEKKRMFVLWSSSVLKLVSFISVKLSLKCYQGVKSLIQDLGSGFLQ